MINILRTYAIIRPIDTCSINTSVFEESMMELTYKKHKCLKHGKMWSVSDALVFILMLLHLLFPRI